MKLGCINPAVFTLTPEMAARGFESEEEVRQEILWERAHQAQANPELDAHVAACHSCAQTARSFELLEEALHRNGDVTLAVCPGAATLARFHYGELHALIDGPLDARVRNHLASCANCTEELQWLARTESGQVRTMPRRALWWGGAAAAAVFILLIPFLRPASYPDLARMPAVETSELSTAAAPANQTPLHAALAALDSGNYAAAEREARAMVHAADDPAAEFVLAMALYREGNLKDGFGAMAKSERMTPMSAYRCWTMLQFALLRGDRAAIERECSHVGRHPEYGDRSRKILEAVRSRRRFS